LSLRFAGLRVHVLQETSVSDLQLSQGIDAHRFSPLNVGSSSSAWAVADDVVVAHFKR
jgi:hypothetical protein